MAKYALKAASKRVNQKPATTTGDLIGNKTEFIITIKKDSKYAAEIPKQTELDEELITIPKVRHIPPEKRQQTINEFRLIQI